MENVGCITYREQVLLIDPRSTQEEQLGVAETVAHELAHMWFGDLVTMRWWNGMRLNEAFATFMSMLAVDAFRPAWGRSGTRSRATARTRSRSTRSRRRGRSSTSPLARRRERDVRRSRT